MSFLRLATIFVLGAMLTWMASATLPERGETIRDFGKLITKLEKDFKGRSKDLIKGASEVRGDTFFGSFQVQPNPSLFTRNPEEFNLIRDHVRAFNVEMEGKYSPSPRIELREVREGVYELYSRNMDKWTKFKLTGVRRGQTHKPYLQIVTIPLKESVMGWLALSQINENIRYFEVVGSKEMHVHFDPSVDLEKLRLEAEKAARRSQIAMSVEETAEEPKRPLLKIFGGVPEEYQDSEELPSAESQVFDMPWRFASPV
ncbi:hypothetical protein IE53DRAFT_383161 [Violaceomyces palustris]|uniref:Uncharacterized protein n=1 Tax=Violaceomyces palustris TaxID=1673888 RepID=A0ACD0P7W0_9BASI|nr:hypothetical protein IE53DRAFT_383161 [Violaceomyces palustris]